MQSGSLFLLSLSLLFSPVFSLYGGKSKVVQLKGSNFNEVVHKNERPFMIEFYAPWCGYCKKLAPEYSQLAVNLEGLVDVAAIDCDDADNRPICSRYGVQGFPTLKFFVFNGKGNHKRAIDYNGSRTLADMTEFIKKNSNGFIFKVSAANTDSKGKWNVDLKTFFSKGETLPKLILFRPDFSTPSTLLFRAISIKYHYKIVVGEVSLKADQNIAEELDVDAKANSLVYFPVGTTSSPIVYSGSTKREEVFGFLDAQLAAKKTQNSAKISEAKSGGDIDSICFEGSKGWCTLVITNSQDSSIVNDAIAKLKTDSLLSSTVLVKVDFDSVGVDILRNLNAVPELPAVVAINSNSKQYALMTQDFSLGSLKTFLNNINSSKVRFISFKDKSLFVPARNSAASDKDEL